MFRPHSTHLTKRRIRRHLNGNTLRFLRMESLEVRNLLSGTVADVALAVPELLKGGAYERVPLISPVWRSETYEDGAVSLQTIESSDLIQHSDFQADARFVGVDGSGYAVAVIDTGINLDHVYFGPDANFDGQADRIVYQYDFADGDADASDFHGHGSNVASIAASSGAHPGMAPGADIIALKVFSDSGGGAYSFDIEAALQWVIENAETYNIAAVNMSLGSGNYTSNPAFSPYNNELTQLADIGVIVVAAAGNGYYEYDSQQGLSSPSIHPDVISVGAVYDDDVGGLSYTSGAIDYSTSPDRVSSFSQRDSELLDIMAPGAIITGASNTGTTSTVSMTGTSQASPHIAGIAVLAQNLANATLGRSLTVDEFRTLLKDSADTIYDGDDEDDNVTNSDASYGRVNVFALGEAILALSGGGQPDLTFFIPPGWDDAIVVSTVPGTNSDADAIAPSDPLYVDWAGNDLNDVPFTDAFAVSLYLDGTLVNTWIDSDGLQSGEYASTEDYALGSLSAGPHVLEIRVDSGDDVVETSESNNSYTKWIDVAVHSDGDAHEDDDVPGEANAIPVDGTSQTHSIHEIGDVDWVKFTTSLWQTVVIETVGVEGNTTLSLYGAGDLNNPVAFDDDGGDGFFSRISSYLAPGEYYVKVDEFESNETIDAYTLTVDGSSSAFIPDLAPFTPLDWDDSIVVSTNPGDNIDAGVINETDQLYVDWAADEVNDIGFFTAFSSSLYVDGAVEYTWTDPNGLMYGESVLVNDYALGTLAPGVHEIELRIDVNDELIESNETNNTYLKSIVVYANPLDYGDAPSPYPTLQADDGAVHVGTGPMLGGARDFDLDGRPTTAADGDDLNGASDDEDGLVSTPLLSPGIRQTPIDVSVSGDGYLNAWIDFDADGVWDSSERIATDLTVATGVNRILVDVPTNAIPGTTYARFRLTSYDPADAMFPTGLASDGEVEDYALTIENDVYLYGEETADDVFIWPGAPGEIEHRIQINGADSYFDAAVYDEIHVDGLEGNDTLIVFGKPTDENADFNLTDVHVHETSVYDFHGASFESIYVYSNGGTDVATMIGSSGDDRLYGRESNTYFKDASANYFNYVNGYSLASADVSSSGGSDTVYLYDGSGDDRLTTDPIQILFDYAATMGTNDPNIIATGFSSVYAYSTNGFDEARMTGSDGDDLYYDFGTHGYLRASDSSYINYVHGFDSITADVSADAGADTAYLYDGPGDDLFEADPIQATLDRDAIPGAPDAEATAIGFNKVYAFATFGGDDSANLTGSLNDDVFWSSESTSYLRAADWSFFNYARGFDTVDAAPGPSGADLAYVYDGAGDDLFTFDPTQAVMDFGATPGVYDPDVTVTGFPRVNAYSRNGGQDEAILTGSDGDDMFYGSSPFSYLRKSDASYFAYVNGFNSVSADVSATSGFDLARLYDSVGDDVYEAGPTQAAFDYDATPGADDPNATAIGFDRVNAYATNGGTDEAALTGSAAVDLFYGLTSFSYLRADDSAYYNYVNGFAAVTAYAVGSGDYAYLYDSNGKDVLTAGPNEVVFELNPKLSPSVTNTASAFDRVYAYASNGGLDHAHLIGTTGDDQFTGLDDWGRLESSDLFNYYNYIRYFDKVYADPGDMVVGNDSLDDEGLSYLLDDDPGNGNVW